MPAVAAGVVVAGIGLAAVRLGRDSRMVRHRADVEQVLRLHDVVFEHSGRMGWVAPCVSTDRFSPCFGPALIRLCAYERHGKFLDARGGFGTTLFRWDEEQVWVALGGSEFVLLTVSEDRAARVSAASEELLDAMRPKLLARCQAEFDELGRFTFFGRQTVLYSRRQPRG
jgi:hypothetical protein